MPPFKPIVFLTVLFDKLLQTGLSASCARFPYLGAPHIKPIVFLTVLFDKLLQTGFGASWARFPKLGLCCVAFAGLQGWIWTLQSPVRLAGLDLDHAKAS